MKTRVLGSMLIGVGMVALSILISIGTGVRAQALTPLPSRAVTPWGPSHHRSPGSAAMLAFVRYGILTPPPQHVLVRHR